MSNNCIQYDESPESVTENRLHASTENCEMADVDRFEVRGVGREDESDILIERLECSTSSSLRALENPAQVSQHGSLRSELTEFDVVRLVVIVEEHPARLFRFVNLQHSTLFAVSVPRIRFARERMRPKSVSTSSNGDELLV